MAKFKSKFNGQSKRDIQQEITDKIIAELEKGTVPWVRPWSSIGGKRFPYNAASGRPYNGANVIVLWIESQLHNYPTQGWMTYNQAAKLGGHVRKGEKHTAIINWRFPQFPKKDKDGNVIIKDGEVVMKTVPVASLWCVFNVAQIDGLSDAYYGIVTPEENDQVVEKEEYKAWVKATEAKIGHGGDQAYYRPSTDEIQMPPVKAFKGYHHYQATLNHELVHWTGAKERCDRDLKNRFGSEAYAAEELVAELGAAFLCAELGVDGELRHASYIQHWIKLLKSDPKAMVTASSRAKDAFNWLMEKTGRNTVEEVEEEMQEAA